MLAARMTYLKGEADSLGLMEIVYKNIETASE